MKWMKTILISLCAMAAFNAPASAGDKVNFKFRNRPYTGNIFGEDRISTMTLFCSPDLAQTMKA